MRSRARLGSRARISQILPRTRRPRVSTDCITWHTKKLSSEICGGDSNIVSHMPSAALAEFISPSREADRERMTRSSEPSVGAHELNSENGTHEYSSRLLERKARRATDQRSKRKRPPRRPPEPLAQSGPM